MVCFPVISNRGVCEYTHILNILGGCQTHPPKMLNYSLDKKNQCITNDSKSAYVVYFVLAGGSIPSAVALSSMCLMRASKSGCVENN